MTGMSSSDHIPIIMEVLGKKQKQKAEKKRICVAKKEHYTNLEIAFAKEKWLSLYKKQNIDEAGQHFEQVKDHYIEKHLPYKTIYVRPDLDKPWYSIGLRNSRYMLSRLRKKALGSKCEVRTSEYNRKKTIYNKLLRKAEQAYTLKQLELHKQDSRRTWQLLNNAISRKSKSADLSRHFSINGTITTDKEKIAEAFLEGEEIAEEERDEIFESISCTREKFKK